MKGGHQGDAAISLPGTTETRDGHLLFQQAFHGGFAQGHDDLGLDEFDLPMQPRRARGHLFGCRRPIAEPFAGRIRAAFQNVRDVHLIAS